MDLRDQVGRESKTVSTEPAESVIPPRAANIQKKYENFGLKNGPLRYHRSQLNRGKNDRNTEPPGIEDPFSRRQVSKK